MSSSGTGKRRRVVDEDDDDHPSGVDADVSYMEEDDDEEEKKNLDLTSTYGGSEEKKKEQKKIYICVELNLNCQTEWYVFDSSSSSGVGEFRREDILSAEVFLRGFACVVCGSKMYFIGGMDDEKFDEWDRFIFPEERNGMASYISNEVKMYDTNQDGGKLVKMESMRTPRWNAIAVYINNRIYVFSGQTLYPSEDPWAEYYDFEKQHWIILDRPLPVEHHELLVRGYAIVDCYRVILWTLFTFYLFNTNQNTCDAVVELKDYTFMIPIPPPLLADDDIVYWFFGDTIFKYDSTNPPSPNDYQTEFTFSKLWDGPPFAHDIHGPFLLPNGKDKFCLFWVDAGRLFCTAFTRCTDGTISWNDRYQYLRIGNSIDRNSIFRPHVAHCLAIHGSDMGQYSDDKRCQGSVVKKSQRKNSLDSKTLLENFSHTIINLCSSCSDRKFYEEEELLRKKRNDEKPSESMDDLELLEDYKIDMSALKGMSKRDFKSLDIPKIDKFKLLCKLGRESEAIDLMHVPVYTDRSSHMDTSIDTDTDSETPSMRDEVGDTDTDSETPFMRDEVGIDSETPFMRDEVGIDTDTDS